MIRCNLVRLATYDTDIDTVFPILSYEWNETLPISKTAIVKMYHVSCNQRQWLYRTVLTVEDIALLPKLLSFDNFFPIFLCSYKMADMYRYCRFTIHLVSEICFTMYCDSIPGFSFIQKNIQSSTIWNCLLHTYSQRHKKTTQK